MHRTCDKFSKAFFTNAYYLANNNKIKYCRGYLNNNLSEFTLARIISHELSHAIDPCNMSLKLQDQTAKIEDIPNLIKLDSQYPIAGLLTCLRSERSIAAISSINEIQKSRSSTFQSDISLDEEHSIKYQNQVSAFSNIPNIKFDHCLNDQITESTSDWFSFELLVDYIEEKYPILTTAQWQIGFSNAMRKICSLTKTKPISDEKFDLHPEVYNRINRLLLVNPKVRAKMNCPKEHPEYIYCDPDSISKKMHDQSDSDKSTEINKSRSGVSN